MSTPETAGAPAEHWAAAQLAVIDAAGLTRRRRVVEPAPGTGVLADGHRAVNFCDNDYL